MRPRVFVLSALVLATSCGGAPPNPDPLPRVPPTQAMASALGSASAPAKAPSVPAPVRRVVVSLGRKSGTVVTTVSQDGTWSVTLDVLENGRGPHTDATFRLGPDGAMTSFHATGHHTMGTPVDETFTRDGTKAKWHGLEETGERDVNGAAFFVPFAELPDAIGLLVQALLKNGGTLPLLPAGEAKLERTGEANVTVAGAPLHLVGYAITGLELLPTRVWMRDDGSFFGFVSPWWSVVPEGAEPTIEPLIALQNELDKKRDRDVAIRLAQVSPAAGTALTHARVLDVERGTWLADQTILVSGGKIAKLGPTASTPAPAGAKVVDLAGKAVLPGLWDMHSHLGDESGVLDVASGVTTARDVGNDPDKLDDWKKRYDDGAAVGPHVLRFGFIEGRNEKAASSKVTAETPEEAKAAVKLFADRGYDGIKIYNSMKPELVPLLASEAHARGLMVTGHVPVHMLANEAVRAGYDGIEHVNMLFLNFFADHDTDTRTTTRFTLVGDRAASFDLKSKPVTDFVALLKQKNTVIDPTIDAFEDLLCGEQGKLIPGLEPLVARLPAMTQRQYLEGGLPIDAEKHKLYLASFEKLLAMVKLLHQAKVPVVVGTDTLAGLMVHHELALFVRAGISPIDALRAATIVPARTMKKDKVSGSIAVGKDADLFVVDGDPVAKIDDVTKVVMTMRGGLLFDARALLATVGVRP
jgi:hypothetical protein